MAPCSISTAPCSGATTQPPSCTASSHGRGQPRPLLGPTCSILSFVPLSVVGALAWTRKVATGIWYVTAVNFNWVLGLLSYYLVPSLGPVFVDPPLADQMPATAV